MIRKIFKIENLKSKYLLLIFAVFFSVFFFQISEISAYIPCDPPCSFPESCVDGECIVNPYCGDGSCNGSETCSSCSTDCGSCIYCGDGSCNGSESCSSCSTDCGECCSCGSWTNAGCGLSPCASTAMKQTRTCSPLGCSAESQCIISSSCGNTLSLTKNIAAAGTVTSNPVGINCGTSCASQNYEFVASQTVILTVSTSTGYVFTGWSGYCSGTGSTCSVPMSAARSVTANYAISYTLSLTKNIAAGGTITSSPTGINCGTSCSSQNAAYASGQSVTLTASPASGYILSAWGGSCSGTGSCVVSMTSAKSVSANFVSSITAPAVTTNAASLVEETTVTINGNITATGGSNPTRYLDWGTSTGSYPNQINLGISGVGTFSTNLTGLTKGALYYFRARGVNSGGTGTGSELTFLTKPDQPTNLTATPASGQITLNWTKGSGASRTLVRRNTGTYPATVSEGTQVYLNTGTSYVDTGLTNGTTYYYSAWSEITSGSLTQYSDVKAQISGVPAVGISAPTVTTAVATLAAVNLQSNQAVLNGNITATGGQNADQRGFEWGTSAGVYSNNLIVGTLGSYVYGAGAFTGTLTLSPGTIIYYRSKAHNSAGWAYGPVEMRVVIYNTNGSQLSFGTIVSNNVPTANGLSVDSPNEGYCGMTQFPPVGVNWNFSDSGDTQSAYRIQVDTDSGFSPAVVDTGTTTDGCAGNCGEYVFQSVGERLNWGTSYYWRIKVVDSYGLESSWVTSALFTTAAHPWPVPNFTHSPSEPTVDEVVAFANTSSCYGSCSYSWDFDYDGSFTPTMFTSNPTTTFAEIRNYTVRIRVTDTSISPNGICYGNGDSPVGPAFNNPEYKEISPFSWIRNLFADLKYAFQFLFK